jgi:hypothetical protein
MPSDAQSAWINVYSIAQARGDEVREVRYMLQRFATRPEMKDAWVELGHFEKITPAYLTERTFLIWCSAMRIKPIGPTSALGIRAPWREIATCASSVADAIRAIDRTILAESGITDTTQLELDRVAGFLKRDAESIEALIVLTPLPRKARARNAHHIAFVNEMCRRLWQANGRRPYALVAILTNVTFDVSEDNQWDANRVKKCYASRSRSKEFGNIERFFGR